MQKEVKEKPRYAVVAAVQLASVSDIEFEASLSELRELAKTLGFTIVRTFIQKRSSFDTTGYLGVGKRQEIHHYVNHEASMAEPGYPDGCEIEAILVDHEISPSQARNLEKEVGCEVLDRTMVILEIFHNNARSRAARAQVEIARLGYMAPRLREAAKLAGPQGRQRSGAGGRGGGESHTELDRRKIRDRIAELQQEIVAMDVERQTQRARRQERQGLAGVALVGYTNAGKSTLMRALTGSEVLVANKLFATLDTTVRALHPESVPRVLVSDTVGFIKNLPHGLVASFKSTLDEALDASLLLHVIDASDPGFERQLEVTDKVLEEISAHLVPRLRIFNKIDHVGDAEAQAECAAALRAKYPDCVVMSARRPDEVARLRQTIIKFFQQGLVEAELFLPWSAQQMRGEIYANCEVLAERADGEGAFFEVRGEPNVVESLREKFALLG
ncbi:MAG: GTPase HflX [Azonexus sp.]|nr:GTPase HflX [Azonexus sp.]MDP3639549.1 GTPase HflX [Azonexus sp.]MDZ4314938.1 GTPase HflX [Azonexus sp.]